MIARQLSDKLKQARQSQRRAESALLAAETSLGSVTASAEAAGLSANVTSAAVMAGAAVVAETGAAAEARALLERGQRYERRIYSLERSLERRDRENGDLKSVVVGVTFALVLVVFGVSDRFGTLADRGYCLGLQMAGMDKFPL